MEGFSCSAHRRVVSVLAAPTIVERGHRSLGYVLRQRRKRVAWVCQGTGSGRAGRESRMDPMEEHTANVADNVAADREQDGSYMYPGCRASHRGTARAVVSI